MRKSIFIISTILIVFLSCTSEDDNSSNTQYTDGIILISETNGNTITSENQETDEIKISLSELPQSNVEVIITIQDVTEIETTSNTLTFNPTNWNIEQTIILKGVDDDIVDGSVNSIIVFSINPNSSATNYQNTESVEITIENIDNDVQYINGNIVITETNGNTVVSENLETDEVKISLSELPQSDVEIMFNIQDNTEIEIISNPPVFNQSNWNVEQTIVIKGLDDNIVDGNINSVIEFSVNSNTTASNYQNTQAIEITVENTDNDTQNNNGNILWTSDLNFNLDTYDDVDLIELNGYYYILDEDADLFKIDKTNGNVVWEKQNITGLNHQDNPAYKAHLFKKNNELIVITSGITAGNGYEKFLRVSSSNGNVLNSTNIDFVFNDVKQLNSGNFLIIESNEIKIYNEFGALTQENTIPDFYDSNSLINGIGGNYALLETTNSLKLVDKTYVAYGNSSVPNSAYFTINKTTLELQDYQIIYQPSTKIGTIYSDKYTQNSLAIIHQNYQNTNSYQFSIYSEANDEVFSMDFDKIYRKNIAIKNNKFIVLTQTNSSDNTFLTEFDVNGNITNNKTYDINMGQLFYKNNFIIDSDGNIVCATNTGKLVKLEY